MCAPSAFSASAILGHAVPPGSAPGRCSDPRAGERHAARGGVGAAAACRRPEPVVPPGGPM
eukprot:4034006-Lingulodinium_polyedra.AAC.1